MYSIIRLMIVGLFLGCSMVVAKKVKVNHKRIWYIVFLGLSVVLIIVLPFCPFENSVITFHSPEAAYEYYILGKSNIKLVVEGKACDFVVDRQSDNDSYLMIPKTANGWKVGIGSSMKKVVQKIEDGVVVYVYQYKNTGDYFVTIHDTKGGTSMVSDEYNTTFYALDSESLNETLVTYYAYIPNFDSQYSITVNGNNIVLQS